MTLGRAVTVRFIEYMPLGDAAALGPLSGPANGVRVRIGGRIRWCRREVRAKIERELGAAGSGATGERGGVGPANVYRLAEGEPRGRIGFISAMSAGVLFDVQSAAADGGRQIAKLPV